MRKTYRRRNYTAAYLLPGCASIGAPILVALLVVGILSLLWLVTHIGVILSSVLSLAVLGNGFAFLLGLAYLGYILLTYQQRQRVAPARTIRIVEIPPTPTPTAQTVVRPELSPPLMAPRSRHKVVTSQPDKDTPEPVYLPGSKRIAGWQYADGTIQWESSQQAKRD